VDRDARNKHHDAEESDLSNVETALQMFDQGSEIWPVSGCTCSYEKRGESNYHNRREPRQYVEVVADLPGPACYEVK